MSWMVIKLKLSAVVEGFVGMSCVFVEGAGGLKTNIFALKQGKG
jgi:hypothetical protein